MEDVKKILLNLRSLRAFAREHLTTEQLDDALEKLNQVTSERHTEEEIERAERAEREAKIEQVAKQLAEQGIDAETLIAALSKQKSKKKPGGMPAKYKYIDDDGQERTWSGQGRKPTFIKNALEQGKKLEDFAI